MRASRGFTYIFLYLVSCGLFFVLPLSLAYGYVAEIRENINEKVLLMVDDSRGIKVTSKSENTKPSIRTKDTSEGLTNYETVIDEKRLNLLLMGLDSRDDNLVGRTDTLMLVSFDPTTGLVDLLSIPRDSYVEIAGKGKTDKINHAYSFGGKDMTINTVENLLGIEIDHYLVFNFGSFISIIDSLGGITVDVPFDFTEQDSNDRLGAIKFTKGRAHIDGEEALAFARMRKQDPEGDIGRAKRQQMVIQSTVDAMRNVSSLSTYITMLINLGETISTDIKVSEIPSLVTSISGVKQFNTIPLTGRNMYIDSIYYMELNDKQLDNAKTRLSSTGNLLDILPEYNTDSNYGSSFSEDKRNPHKLLDYNLER